MEPAGGLILTDPNPYPNPNPIPLFSLAVLLQNLTLFPCTRIVILFK